MGEHMNILCFSDFHGAIDILPQLVEKIKQENPDLLLFCGDVVKGYARGNEWLDAVHTGRIPHKELDAIKDEFAMDDQFIHSFYSTLGDLAIPFVAVAGNMDAPIARFSKKVEQLMNHYPSIHFLHGSYTSVNSISIGGFGGEIHPAEENYFITATTPSKLKQKLSLHADILVFHQPPIGSVVSMEGAVQKGHSAVNSIIEKAKPSLVFCGHAHRGQGQEKMGNTVVINPGALKNTNYALVNWDEDITVDFSQL